MDLFLYTRIRSDMFDEIKEISKASNVSEAVLTLLNHFYELDGTACTSVVARARNNSIIFGSNLDFMFVQEIFNLTYEGHYYKNGQLIYKTNSIYGIVGAIRGSRVGNYSIAINQREGEDNVFRELFLKNSYETLYFVKYILQNAETFDEAIKLAESTPLMSTAYYTIGGKSGNEGCVIERSNRLVHGKYCLNSTNWFLVQTNYDRNLPDSPNDFRRVPLEKKMEIVGNNNIDAVKIFQLLAEDPNHVIGNKGRMDEATLTTVISMNDHFSFFDLKLWNVTILPVI